MNPHADPQTLSQAIVISFPNSILQLYRLRASQNAFVSSQVNRKRKTSGCSSEAGDAGGDTPVKIG